jgi:pilus assembly protein Flp/PilA
MVEEKRMSFEVQKTAIVQKFLGNESGASEYGLIAAGISVAIFSVLQRIGADLILAFMSVANDLAVTGR